jgi:hypothetical protein
MNPRKPTAPSTRTQIEFSGDDTTRLAPCLSQYTLDTTRASRRHAGRCQRPSGQVITPTAIGPVAHSAPPRSFAQPFRRSALWAVLVTHLSANKA